MAEWKGFEPSTSRVTGGRSNQLNYHSNEFELLVGDIGLEPMTPCL